MLNEHDVMALVGHSSLITTHEFYLAMADDLVHRARVATAQCLRQKLVHLDTPAPVDQKMVDSIYRNSLYCNDLNLEHP